MKKGLLATLLISWSVFLGAQDITVTKPNGGETWSLGSTHNITWTTTLTSGSLRIILFDGANSLGTIAQNLPVTQHSFSWSVGHLIDAPDVGTGTNYMIKIRQQGLAPKDFSDAPFSITSATPPGKFIHVDRPNGGEEWPKGSRHTITWTPTGFTSGYFEIALWQGGTQKGVVATGIPFGTHNHAWTVGDMKGGKKAAAGSGYTIRVRLLNDTVSDGSDAPFTISSESQEQPGVTGKLIDLKIHVTHPDAASTWDTGCTYTIRWETPVKNVFTIELYRSKRSKKLDTIGTMMPIPSKQYGGKYSYTWSIPSNYAHLGKCCIRVSTLNGSTSGFSRTFTLNQGTALDIAPLE